MTLETDDTNSVNHNPAVVVAKSSASAILAPGESFGMNFQGEPGTFSVKYWTEYGGEFETPIPVKFCAEVRGAAYDLHDACWRFANAARVGSTILAFTANACLGELQPELVFDGSPTRDEHEFLQIMVPDRPLVGIPSRRINLAAVHAIAASLAGHNEIRRIRRAISQYVHALSLWTPGCEIQCLAHLYMAVEALTKARLRHHLATCGGLSEDDLTKQWGINRKQLDAAVRLKLIFSGDRDTYKNAKAVSDGLEHGFSEYEELRPPACEVVVKTSQYVRRAILETLGVSPCICSRMLEANYANPRGPLSLPWYLFGTLNGKASELAAPDQLYPMMHMKSRIKSVTLGNDGIYSFTPEQSFTASLGSHVTFTLTRFEMWDGSTITERLQNPANDDVQSQRGERS